MPNKWFWQKAKKHFFCLLGKISRSDAALLLSGYVAQSGLLQEISNISLVWLIGCFVQGRE